MNAKSDVWPGSAAVDRLLTEKINIRFINHPSLDPKLMAAFGTLEGNDQALQRVLV